jgi:hypothetical protein
MMMKKALTILIAGILITSGMQISLDRHYCGGSLADIKVSFTGKLASCGMERHEAQNTAFPVITNRCCEDQVSVYSISANWYPEFFQLSHPSPVKGLDDFQTVSLLYSNSYSSGIDNRVLPPGYRNGHSVTQAGICIFRI